MERLGGSPSGGEAAASSLFASAGTDPAAPRSDQAIDEGVSQPALQAERSPLLADLMPQTPPDQPAWMAIWNGRSPATYPASAAEMSADSPDSYADWLRSTLPDGCAVRRQWATVTAYCPCAICCDERTGRTATGRLTDIHPYGVAADFRLLRRGTKLHVPGYLTESAVGGIWPVDDTGGALRRSRTHGVLHLDVRYVSHEWAERWGTRKMWVYVVTGPVDPN